MAHTAPPTGSNRHLDRIFGVLLLLVGVAVAVVAVLALNHPKGRVAASGSPQATTKAPSSASASKPKTSTSASHPSVTPSTPSTSTAGAGRLPLIVLNNSSQITASSAADRFRQGGWTVTDTSTFEGSILSTAVYYDPNVTGAQAAAEALQRQFPSIKRVKEKFDGLPEGPVVVVLTSDYS